MKNNDIDLTRFIETERVGFGFITLQGRVVYFSHTIEMGKYEITYDQWYKIYTRANNNAGLLKSNELGLYDMSGNVRERHRDYYGTIGASSEIDPKSVINANALYSRVVRGGSYLLPETTIVSLHGSGCDSNNAYTTDLGFRVCRTAH